MKVPQPPPQSSERRPQKTRRKGLLWFLGAVTAVTIALAFVLFTPSGQRWAVHQVLGMVVGSVGNDGGKVQVELDAVDLGWSPLGLSLNGLDLIQKGGSDDGIPLASLSQLVVLPADRSGQHWLTVSAEGLTITREGSQWLMNGTSGTSEPDPTDPDAVAPLSIADLDLRNVRIALPDSLAASPWSHEIFIEEASVQGLTWQGGWPEWSNTAGLVQLRSQDGSSGPVNTTNLAWEDQGHPFTVRLSTAPAFWLDNALYPSTTVSALPGEWAAQISRRDSTLELTGTADWGTVRLLGGLDGQNIQLDTVALHYTKLPVELPMELPPHGHLMATGPITLPIPEEMSPEVDWQGLLGELSLTYRHAPLRGTPFFASAQWDLGSGDIASLGEWHTRTEGALSVTQFSWSAQGQFAPISALDLSSPAHDSRLEGTWSMERDGDEAGSGAVDGTLDIVATANDAQGVDVHWDVSARTAPICLTEGLELYGGWGSSGEVTISDEGGIDSWWGHIDLNGGRFIPLPGFDGRQRQGAPLSMKRFHARGRGDHQGFEVDLEGDFIEGHIDGPHAISAWKAPLIDALVSGEIITESTAKKWRAGQAVGAHGPSDWTANFTVWRDDLLERYSHSQWSIGSGSHVEVKHRDGEVTFMLDLRPLHVGDVMAHNVTIAGRGGKVPMEWQAYADSVRHTDYGMISEVALSAEVGLTSGSQFRASWDGGIPVDLALEHHLEEGNVHVVTPSKLDLSFSDATWQLDPQKSPRLRWTEADWTSIMVDNMRLSGSQGLLSIQSNTRGSNRDGTGHMTVRLDRLPVAPWLVMLGPSTGVALPQGDGLLHAAFDIGLSPFSVKGTAQWEDARFEGFDLGDLCLNASWSDQPRLEFEQFKGEDEVLHAEMTSTEAVALNLFDWPLEQLEPLFTDAGVALKGSATGKLAVSLQKNGAPTSVQGDLTIDAQALSIGVTGMTYALKGDLDFNDGLIGMDMGQIMDPNGQRSLLNLSVLHTNFSDWNYDLGLELPEAFQVMDLAADRSKLFYGSVLVTGDANVSGTADNLSIQVDARSAEGTQFTMPLDAMEGPGIPSGIRFTGGSAADVPEDKAPSPLDVSMAIEIEVTPEAELSLVLDQQAGERVDGRAQGALSLVSNRNQSLAMEGGLEILEGQYRFSLRDLFTKTIDVAPGGRIDWDGNPYEARLDLLAIASMKASPEPLLPGIMYPVGKTDVEVGMGISGELASPTLDFSISFPTYAKADPELLAQVQPALATPEETQRQAFALLAAGQFIPSDKINSNTLGRATAAAQATDLVSTGVSELLSNLSDDVEIGLRYLPSASGAAIDPNSASAEDAFEMDLGLNLLNDRLKISGTLGARSPDGLQVDPAAFTGAIDLRYQLTADGRWELMGYSKPESDLENSGQYRYGLGAVYQVRFDHLRDFLRKSEAP